MVTIDYFTELSLKAYSFIANSFPNAKDPDGKRVIFVNGHWNSLANKAGLSPGAGLRSYWNYFNPNFINEARTFLKVDKTETNLYVDGSSRWGGDQSGADRFKLGQQYAEKHFDQLTEGMSDGEGFEFVSHSEGGAFAAGMATYLSNRLSLAGSPNNYVKSMLYLSPDEADEFSSPENILSFQVHYKDSQDRSWNCTRKRWNTLRPLVCRPCKHSRLLPRRYDDARTKYRI